MIEQLLLAVATALVTALVGVAVRAYLLEVAVAITRAWIWLFTVVMEPQARERVREERYKLLLDRLAKLDDERLNRAEVGMKTLVRWLKGVPADVLWAIEMSWPLQWLERSRPLRRRRLPALPWPWWADAGGPKAMIALLVFLYLPMAAVGVFRLLVGSVNLMSWMLLGIGALATAFYASCLWLGAQGGPPPGYLSRRRSTLGESE